MKKLLFIYFGLLFSLISCTPYGPSGFAGGYTDHVLGSGYYSVNFAGNGYTSPERVGDMALLRACELARNDGYAKFIILGGRGNTTVDHAYTPGVATTTGNFSQGVYSSTTLYTPPMDIPISKPDANISIQGLTIASKVGDNLELTIQRMKQKYRIQ